MRGNTTAIKLLKGVVNRAFNPLFQYDYGQKLVFEETQLPMAYEVHFSNSECGKSKVCIGNSEGVDIPDEYLLSGEPVYVWVFLHDGENDGETEYRGMIPVIQRPESTDIPVTPVEQDVITQTIAALNEAVELSNSNVEHYPKIVDGYWYVWDAELGDFVNTGVDSHGEDGPYFTPHVTSDGIISWTNNGDLPNPSPVNIVENLDFVKHSELPTKVSDLVDDSGHYTKPQNGIPFEDLSDGVTGMINGKLNSSEKGSINGIAELDEYGKVPSSQLPSYVDDIVEYPSKDDFPNPGESGKLYVDTSTNEIFRWSGSMYVSVSEAGADHAPKNNPVFTGSISLGRKSNTTVGSRSSAIGLEVTASGANSHGEGNNTQATGTSSHAEGGSTKATATYAHSEGQSTEATNSSAHAEGTSTHATAYSSHAEGNVTTASGNCSHAEGQETTASGIRSHAEGSRTTASSDAAHAEGWSTIASGAYSHAEGYGGTYTRNDATYVSAASGTYSHTEGLRTMATHDASHAEGHHTIASNNYAHAEGTNTTASGTGAHAEGSGTIASAYYSHAEGDSTIASNYNAHAEGGTTTASGVDSHAEGGNTTASGDNAHAEGAGANASGSSAHAEGGATTASGTNAHAEGYYTNASGSNAHAEGSGTTASKNCAHAEGGGTTASGFNAHAEGGGTQATASQSHAEGGGTIASGDNAHAEGGSTTASGANAHAEGGGTQATASQSHAEGGGTTASGFNAHAEGSGTTASGNSAHAEGNGTIASGSNSHVSGEYNIEDSYDNWDEWVANTSYAIGDKVKRTTVSNDVTNVQGYICFVANNDSTFKSSKWIGQSYKMNFAEIVGNGLSSSSRSNARALDWDGNEYLKGDLYVGCSSDSTGGNKVATESAISSMKGAANGIAGLDGSGKVPSSQLPSYVDDVVEYASLSAFPATGETGKIYVALDTDKTYRWSGSAYIEIGGTGTIVDVQVNGTSVVSSGVANVPLANTTTPGAVIVGAGLQIYNNKLLTNPANSISIKNANAQNLPIVPYYQHESVFYGLAKAAGDSTQASSSNAVGTYTDGAKAAIKTMLGVSEGIEVVRLI